MEESKPIYYDRILEELKSIEEIKIKNNNYWAVNKYGVRNFGEIQFKPHRKWTGKKRITLDDICNALATIPELPKPTSKDKRQVIYEIPVNSGIDRIAVFYV